MTRAKSSGRGGLQKESSGGKPNTYASLTLSRGLSNWVQSNLGQVTWYLIILRTYLEDQQTHHIVEEISDELRFVQGPYVVPGTCEKVGVRCPSSSLIGDPKIFQILWLLGLWRWPACVLGPTCALDVLSCSNSSSFLSGLSVGMLCRATL